MYTSKGYSVKVKGIRNLNKAVQGLILSDDHEVNKKLLMAIMQTAELLMQSEEIAIAYANNDVESMTKAANKKWVII